MHSTKISVFPTVCLKLKISVTIDGVVHFRDYNFWGFKSIVYEDITTTYQKKKFQNKYRVGIFSSPLRGESIAEAH